jgi:hypothetical protein
MVIKSILQRFWLVAIQQWLPCRQINLIRKKVNFDLLDSWASLHPFLGNLQSIDISISPWGTLLQISIIGDSIIAGKSVYLGAVYITDNAISRSGNNVYRDPNKRGGRPYKPKCKKNKGMKKANSTKRVQLVQH